MLEKLKLKLRSQHNIQASMSIQRHEAQEQLLFFCKDPSRGITDPDEPPDPHKAKTSALTHCLNEKLQGVHGKSPENSNHGQGTGRLLTSIRSGEARVWVRLTADAIVVVFTWTHNAGARVGCSKSSSHLIFIASFRSNKP